MVCPEEDVWLERRTQGSYLQVALKRALPHQRRRRDRSFITFVAAVSNGLSRGCVSVMGFI